MRELIRTHRAMAFGVVLLGILVIIAVLGPLLINTDPNAIDVSARFQGPSTDHPPKFEPGTIRRQRNQCNYVREIA